MTKKADSSSPKSRSRFTPEQRGGIAPGERDAALLTDLFLHQAMSREQIQALYFGSVPRCNARLRQLFDWNFVTRYFLPQARYGAQAVYGIGAAAVPLVASRLDMDETAVRQLSRNRTPQFLEHTLAIVDFYLALRQEMESQGDIEIVQWLPEMQCRHEYDIRASGGVWRTEVFKPDAFVRLGATQSGLSRSYFVEVDRGHTSARQFVLKLQHHQRYLESGLFAEMFGGGDFHTLVITTSVTRQENLRSLIAEQQSDLFWFTTFDAVTQTGALGSIWRIPAQEQAVCLL